MTTIASTVPIVISTHSLTRRLTAVWKWRHRWWSISTHSLTRRLTFTDIANNKIYTFQLTASQGGWRGQRGKRAIPEHFNSQPHKEADQAAIEILGTFVSFQLTASQGGWPVSFPAYIMRGYFNSQPHKEADDLCCCCGICGWSISTHSLTRRLTSEHTISLILLKHFNSQPHKEADVTARVVETGLKTFQLTASQGGWR